jgi:hypothetical protein
MIHLLFHGSSNYILFCAYWHFLVYGSWRWEEDLHVVLRFMRPLIRISSTSATTTTTTPALDVVPAYHGGGGGLSPPFRFRRWRSKPCGSIHTVWMCSNMIGWVVCMVVLLASSSDITSHHASLMQIKISYIYPVSNYNTHITTCLFCPPPHSPQNK